MSILCLLTHPGLFALACVNQDQASGIGLVGGFLIPVIISLIIAIIIRKFVKPEALISFIAFAMIWQIIPMIYGIVFIAVDSSLFFGIVLQHLITVPLYLYFKKDYKTMIKHWYENKLHPRWKKWYDEYKIQEDSVDNVDNNV